MTMVDCGGQAGATRHAALDAQALEKTRYTLPAKRYARWLGVAQTVPNIGADTGPEWLLTAVVLGPDM